MPLRYRVNTATSLAQAGEADEDEKTQSQTVPGIQDHAWSPDRSFVAVCPNTQTGEVLIYATGGSEDCSKWKVQTALTSHKMIAMGVDWSAQNQIVTSGQDRNAFVYTKDDSAASGWKEEMVVLQTGRAATVSRWSPDGVKFATGTADKQIPICYFQKDQQWWVAKAIKKGVKSTVTDVAWHPSNQLLLAASTDKKCKIYSAYHVNFGDSSVHEQVASLFPAVAAKLSKNKKKTPHQLVWQSAKAEDGWVNAVAWSPCGTRFAYALHDSSVTFGQIDGGEVTTQKVLVNDLPFLAVSFLDPDTVVAGGFGKAPFVFRRSGATWGEGDRLDKGQSAVKKKTSAFAGKMAMFNAGGKGKVKAKGLKTRHQNDITSLRVLTPTTFSTSSMDGNIFFWDTTKEY